MSNKSELIKAMQYIADVYHCSDEWGTEVTVDEMRVSLEEWAKECNPGEYVPDVSLAADLAKYWNELCRSHPA